MNISKRHNLSIVVNGEELEVESQDKINLRINNTVYNPEKVSVTQSEYSFSFNVPQTPKNNRIFGFANVPSVKGKFVRQFNTYVYADEVEIFNGLLRISSISDGKYKCNLISMKNSSIDEIFGDSKMNEVRWEVPYVGTATQNAVNQQDNPDYFFPLVCYGAFQKDPYMYIKGEDTDLKYFTSTNLLDKWTKFYNETFVPSPKLVEIVKRMIQQKGYTYSGDAFTDDLLSKLYLSSSITSEQDPAYNIGGNRGKIIVDFNYHIQGQKEKNFIRRLNNYMERDLTYPECYHNLFFDEKRDDMGEDTALIYTLWQDDYGNGSVYQNNDDMWENGYIIIPHDGFYKVRIDADIQLNSRETTVEDSFPYLVLKDPRNINEWKLMHFACNKPMNLDNLSYDIQLVKNGSYDLEFIAPNKINHLRQPFDLFYGDYTTEYTDFPHEASRAYSKSRTSTGSWRRGSTGDSEYYWQTYNNVRHYDPKVNENFVMGMSTASNAWGIMKNGKSWDAEIDAYNYNIFRSYGYLKTHTDRSVSPAVTTTSLTDYHAQLDNDVPECRYTRLSDKSANGTGYAIMWFNKNDILDLKLMTKQFKKYKDLEDDGEITYTVPDVTVSGRVEISAFSPSKRDIKKSWNSASSFDTNLNIGNFLSEEETQKDFFNNFLTTFNLSCNVENGNIEINKNVGLNSSSEAVEVDNRVNVNDVEMEIIDFPTSIQVKWTTSDAESGFYHSVPDDHINDDDWKDWADIGTEKVSFVKNDFNKNDISKTSKFSYNWWMDFNLTDYFVRMEIPGQGGGSSWEKINHIENGNVTLSLPIVAKDENFIDGGNYEEMMKKDGRSLKQRLWFKGEATPYCVPNRNGAKYNVYDEFVDAKEFIDICVPTKYYQGKDVLNFTKDKDSLLMRYFNVNENVDSNYATIEVYLTPQEYMRIKNGAMVRFDNDRYQICSITGYDPTCANKAKLKLMKL